MKQRQPAEDDKPDVIALETINHEINLLLKRLHSKGACPCCVGQAMMYRGAFLYQEIVGTEETAALCLDIADSIEPPDDAGGMPVSDTQH